MTKKSMNTKKTTIIVLAIAVVLAIVLLRSDKTAEQSADTAESLQQELESLNVGDLETEFQGIDQGLQSL